MKKIPFLLALFIVAAFTIIFGWLIINSSKQLFVEMPIFVKTKEIIKDNSVNNKYVSGCQNSDNEDMSNDLDLIVEEIGKKQYCFQAVDLAEDCAWGAAADMQITSVASTICMKEFEKNKPSEKLNSQLKNMQSLCDENYNKLEGTMYLSANAFCCLNALEWVNNISSISE